MEKATLLSPPHHKREVCIYRRKVLPNSKSNKKNSNETTLRACYGISTDIGHRLMRLDSCLRKLKHLGAWKWAASGKVLPPFQLQITGHKL